NRSPTVAAVNFRVGARQSGRRGGARSSWLGSLNPAGAARAGSDVLRQRCSVMTLTPSVRAISLCSFPCVARSPACASLAAISAFECFTFLAISVPWDRVPHRRLSQNSSRHVNTGADARQLPAADGCACDAAGRSDSRADTRSNVVGTKREFYIRNYRSGKLRSYRPI